MSPSAGAVVYGLDLSRLAGFYEHVVGLTVASRGDAEVTLTGPGLALHLVLVPPAVAARLVLADPVERRSDTAVKLVLPVADLAAARDLAPTYGGVVDAAAHEWTWDGTVRCDGHDPEGNPLQLVTAGGPGAVPGGGVGGTA